MTVELISRTVESFVLATILELTFQEIDNNMTLLTSLYLLVIPIFSSFSYFFDMNITLIKFINQKQLRKWLIRVNCAMVFYYILLHYIVNFNSFLTRYFWQYRSLFVATYLFIIAWLFVKLDRHAKDQLQLQLDRAQKERIDSIKRYNNYIEQLYREIRTVKHDSENILISLKDSVDQGEIDLISKVYYNVIRASASSMTRLSSGYSSLANIKESAIRSLLNAKLLEAQQMGIEVYVEIPESVEQGTIELLDFMAILRSLLDNAIEAAKESRGAFLSIAYFNQDHKQFFIIENSSQLKRIDMARFFCQSQFDMDYKKEEQTNDILERLKAYPNVILSTRSDHYRLRQIIEMRKPDEYFYS
ncbi:GHKL domain-containing protein [Streptococcus didelphis]|uniref:GHKL domain-containing protein n=2 Tax=Streptococcus didelphis TaxID=102886 RepID=A0ABY9LFQ8_9STRE|nr:GHKL domain-containing protein [Streptococcus didelphis]WMB27747.1 GHKL domain-containing protein [Streptococcus didelphis]